MFDIENFEKKKEKKNHAPVWIAGFVSGLFIFMFIYFIWGSLVG